MLGLSSFSSLPWASQFILCPSAFSWEDAGAMARQTPPTQAPQYLPQALAQGDGTNQGLLAASP